MNFEARCFYKRGKVVFGFDFRRVSDFGFPVSSFPGIERPLQ